MNGRIERSMFRLQQAFESPQIVVDFGYTTKSGIDFKNRLWEGHIRCFGKLSPSNTNSLFLDAVMQSKVDA